MREMLHPYGNSRVMLLINLRDINGWKIKKNITKSGSTEEKFRKRVLFRLKRKRAKRKARKVQRVTENIVELAL